MAWAQPSENTSVIVLGSREGYDATAERPFGKCHVLFFISPLSFTFPQTLQFLGRTEFFHTR